MLREHWGGAGNNAVRKQWEATLDRSESVPRAFTLCSAWGEALSGMLRESDIVCRFRELAVSLEKGEPSH